MALLPPPNLATPLNPKRSPASANGVSNAANSTPLPRGPCRLTVEPRVVIPYTRPTLKAPCVEMGGLLLRLELSKLPRRAGRFIRLMPTPRPFSRRRWRDDGRGRPSR